MNHNAIAKKSDLAKVIRGYERAIKDIKGVSLFKLYDGSSGMAA